jgi:tRNA G10  N-methylase Trm11
MMGSKLLKPQEVFQPMFLLAQCTAGLQDFVAEQLAQNFSSVDIEHTEEGLVVFSGADIDTKKLPYINNIFLILQTLKNEDMDSLLTACVRETCWHQSAQQSISKNEKTFRLFLSDENKLVSADRAKLDKLITQIEQQCRITHTSHKPDTEFWLFRRRGEIAYFCKRLTKNRMTEKDLNPGELRPELAKTLCLISEPETKDIFLDPFAGSGAIALARKEWAYEMMFVSDIAPEKVQAIKKNIPRTKKPIIVRAADATHLDKIEDGFIDKVVTDPPWGLFDKSIKDVPAFYKNTLQEMCRVVKPGGLIVMLTGQREMIADLSQHFKNKLALERRFDILVSGKKASIVKWRRTHGT